MRRAVLVLIAACGTPAERPPPKAPNNELVVGDFTRKPPDGEMAVRFAGDGTFLFAKNKGELDKQPHLADGTYKVDGDQLTFTATQGMCADGAQAGSYKVVISKIGIRFTKVNDGCADRARLDGQTLWRLK
jgi:uncharacterized protein (TIGR03066 family)